MKAGGFTDGDALRATIGIFRLKRPKKAESGLVYATPAPKGFIVVIGFDSVEKARAWYDSPDYAAIRPFRQSSTKSRIFIAEGVAAQ